MKNIKLTTNGYNEYGPIFIAEGTPFGMITITLDQLVYVSGSGREAYYNASATATKADDEDFEVDCHVEWDIEDWEAYADGDEDCCDWDNPRAIEIDYERYVF